MIICDSSDSELAETYQKSSDKIGSKTPDEISFENIFSGLKEISESEQSQAPEDQNMFSMEKDEDLVMQHEPEEQEPDVELELQKLNHLWGIEPSLSSIDEIEKELLTPKVDFNGQMVANFFNDIENFLEHENPITQKSCQNERNSNTGQDSDCSNNPDKPEENKLEAVEKKEESKIEEEDKKQILNIEEELKNTIFNDKGTKKKIFSDLSSKNTIRAWEKIQNVSKLLKTEHRPLVIEEIIKAKRNQNCGGDRFAARHSPPAPAVSGDKDTFRSSKQSISLSVEQKVTKVYPYKIHQKIFRIMRKYFKLKFEKFLKAKKIVFNRAAKNMDQDTFNSYLIDFMDEFFPSMIEEMNESTVEKIMETISIFILKDRHKKKEPITEGLDFTEWNDL